VHRPPGAVELIGFRTLTMAYNVHSSTTAVRSINLFRLFSDSRTTFAILSRFADHQGCDEKNPFSQQKFPITVLLLIPQKSLNFLNISCFLYFLTCNTFRYKFQFLPRNFQFNDLFSKLNKRFSFLNKMIKIDKFPTLLAAHQADARGPPFSRPTG